MDEEESRGRKRGGFENEPSLRIVKAFLRNWMKCIFVSSSIIILICILLCNSQNRVRLHSLLIKGLNRYLTKMKPFLILINSVLTVLVPMRVNMCQTYHLTNMTVLQWGEVGSERVQVHSNGRNLPFTGIHFYESHWWEKVPSSETMMNSP